MSVQIYDSDIMKLKRKFLSLIWNNKNVMTALDYSEYDEENPDDCMYKVLFPYIKIDGTISAVKTYIGLKIDTTSISRNDIYKNFVLTISVICHNEAMRTNYGGTRTDVVCGELIKMLNWNNKVGFDLELFFDVEDPLDKTYYMRTIKFKSITSNSMVNGVKQQ